MAVMIIGGERYTNVPVWLKGRLLTDTVEATADIAVLSVESGSEVGKRWNVRHDGTHAESCDCPARGNCCHMIAAERYLGLASDTQAHLDDMSENEDEPMAAQAELPVVVEDYEHTNSWIIEDGAARCVRTADLALACPDGYELAGEAGVEKLNAILASQSVEPASCAGCGQRVRHEGFCYKCAA